MPRAGRGRVITGVGVIDDPTFSNPIPDIPTNFRYDEDDTGRWLKWDKSTVTSMATGTYEVYQSDTYSGTYSEISGSPIKVADISGTTVSFKVVVTTSEGKWYKIRAKNKYNNYSDWTKAIQFPDYDTDYILVTFTITRSPNVPYIGRQRPIVFIDPTQSTLFKDTHNDRALADKKKIGIRVEESSGFGFKRVKRSSKIGNAKYDIVVNIGDYEEKVGDGVTIEGGVSDTQIDLNDITGVDLSVI